MLMKIPSRERPADERVDGYEGWIREGRCPAGTATGRFLESGKDHPRRVDGGRGNSGDHARYYGGYDVRLTCVEQINNCDEAPVLHRGFSI